MSDLIMLIIGLVPTLGEGQPHPLMGESVYSKTKQTVLLDIDTEMS